MQKKDDMLQAAVMAHMKQQYTEAEENYLAVIKIDERSVSALTNLGILLAQTNRPTEASARFSAALKLAPNDISLLNNLGRLLLDQGQIAQAETLFRKALARGRNNATTLGHIGLAKSRMSDVAAAAEWYRRALDADDTADWVRYNLALTLLSEGRFEEAWPLHESRFSERWPDHPVTAPELPFPRWHGEPLAGKSIIVVPEQGHGDEIQFVRFAGRLKELGASKVTWACKPALATLFAPIEGVEITSFSPGMTVLSHDYWVMAMSLPFCIGASLNTIRETAKPYLQATVSAGQRAIEQEQAPYKIGLVWRGSKGLRNDHNRSIFDISPLLALSDINKVRLFSLQKGEGEDEAKEAASLGKLVHLGSEIENFEDTASMISQLDLIITVDTAVAHLAGALGKPVWVMLPFRGTDWRWMNQGEHSPWYPSMRLFRQLRPGGDWSKVVEKIRQQLLLIVTVG